MPPKLYTQNRRKLDKKFGTEKRESRSEWAPKMGIFVESQKQSDILPWNFEKQSLP